MSMVVEGVSLNLEEQRPSRFPFNQVDETPSGHVVEYDDTLWWGTYTN